MHNYPARGYKTYMNKIQGLTLGLERWAFGLLYKV